MKRDKLKDTMARRSPLAQRESVDPVDLYTFSRDGEQQPDAGDNAVSQQLEMSTSRQADTAMKQHVHKGTNLPIEAAETPRRRYTTYLKPETIKAIKWHALDGERNDYDVVQEALDHYLRRLKR